ncbi:MAG TPA: IS6 family transposase [Thermoplasmatales archaeon]|nr:IS6 family transposase [Thermoplasmatales archaeon]
MNSFRREKTSILSLLANSSKISKSLVTKLSRQWYHKLARLFTNSKKYRRCIAIDETKIKIGNKWHYIWAVIDIETWEILGIMVTEWRTSIDVIKFVRSFLPYCENKSLIKIDRAPWYKWALQRMGLQYGYCPNLR